MNSRIRNSLRPRFSVRTLAVAVALACAYLAAWGPTKRAATSIATNTWTSSDQTDAREQHVVLQCEAVAPLFIYSDEVHIPENKAWCSTNIPIRNLNLVV